MGFAISSSGGRINHGGAVCWDNHRCSSWSPKRSASISILCPWKIRRIGNEPLQETFTGTESDRTGAREPGHFLRSRDFLSRIALADDFKGQLSQCAGSTANEGGHRADGQRGAFPGRRADGKRPPTGGKIPPHL